MDTGGRIGLLRQSDNLSAGIDHGAGDQVGINGIGENVIGILFHEGLNTLYGQLFCFRFFKGIANEPDFLALREGGGGQFGRGAGGVDTKLAYVVEFISSDNLGHV